MKKLVTGIVLSLALSSFLLYKSKEIPVTKNISYGTGEELEYRVNLAFFTVGKATTRVDKRYHEINGRTCFKVDAYGETSDWISWVAKVDDIWGAYVDTTTLNTQVSYRKLKEGHYRRDELINFDQHKNKVEVRVKNRDTGVYDEPKVYEVPPNSKDLVAGFLFLRIVDFNKIPKGDTISISGFFEDAFYHLKIIYQGKEVVSTRVGKIQCVRLRPIMPNNAMFDGENSILCWVSDDLNRIPVKLQAKMFIGTTGLELTNFRGLRNQLKIVP